MTGKPDLFNQAPAINKLKVPKPDKEPRLPELQAITCPKDQLLQLVEAVNASSNHSEYQRRNTETDTCTDKYPVRLIQPAEAKKTNEVVRLNIFPLDTASKDDRLEFFGSKDNEVDFGLEWAGPDAEFARITVINRGIKKKPEPHPTTRIISLVIPTDTPTIKEALTKIVNGTATATEAATPEIVAPTAEEIQTQIQSRHTDTIDRCREVARMLTPHRGDTIVAGLIGSLGSAEKFIDQPDGPFTTVALLGDLRPTDYTGGIAIETVLDTFRTRVGFGELPMLENGTANILNTPEATPEILQTAMNRAAEGRSTRIKDRSGDQSLFVPTSIPGTMLRIEGPGITRPNKFITFGLIVQN